MFLSIVTNTGHTFIEQQPHLSPAKTNAFASSRRQWPPQELPLGIHREIGIAFSRAPDSPAGSETVTRVPRNTGSPPRISGSLTMMLMNCCPQGCKHIVGLFCFRAQGFRPDLSTPNSSFCQCNQRFPGQSTDAQAPLYYASAITLFG